MMKLYKDKINNVLEYILIFVLFIIGVKKGGYYKEDSILGVYIIQLIALLFYIFNIKNLKKNRVVSFFLLIFSISYFIAAIINPATISGALNIAIRMYTMYLLYCIIINSENKEKYIKSIVIMTTIFAILGIDELGLKILDKPLKIIGSGYLEEETGKLSSVIQYSNLIGILCVISIIYLLDKIQNDKSNKKSMLYTLVTFLSITIFLTQSKMSLLLYIVSIIILAIMNRKHKELINNIVILIYSYIVSILVNKLNIYLTIAISMFVYYLYSYLLNGTKLKKYNDIFNISIILISVIFFIFNFNIVLNSNIFIRIDDYIKNFDSTKLRILYYIDAIKILEKSPLNFIFGMGGNCFRVMYETVQNVEYISLEVHSLFIQILVESGIIGLIAILIPIIYTLIKSEKNVYRLMFSILLIFAMFDVYLTYTYMMFIFVIILALNNNELSQLKRIDKIFISSIFIFVIVINTSFSLAYIIDPIKTDNLNNSLEEQEEIIKRCDIVLKLDPYDMSYKRNYTKACKAYLDIMDIKKEIYNQDDIQKRLYISSLIENNVMKELKYERYNKYAIEDNLYNICKNIDYIVQNNYSSNIEEGYIYYLDYILKTAEILKTEHKYNDLSKEMYDDIVKLAFNKYYQINILLNSEKIKNTLETIEEKNNISL